MRQNPLAIFEHLEATVCTGINKLKIEHPLCVVIIICQIKPWGTV
jgi:hypothetical protein